MSKLSKWIVGLPVAVCILVAGTAFALARHERVAAHSLVLDLQDLLVGTSGEQQVKAFVKAHGLDPVRDSGGSSYQIVLDNTLLARLRLAPWTRLGVLVGLKDGTLDYVSLEYYVACRADMSSGIRIEELPALSERAPYQVTVIPLGGKPPTIKIELTPAAGSDQRSKAFGLNIGCLTRLGGCSGASELLPSIGMKGLNCDNVSQR